MLQLNPSPWLFFAVPFLLVCGYITYRGLIRNEFRRIARSGWYEFKPWSVLWISATFSNVVFLTAGAFFFYQALFHGTGFDRQPELSLPSLEGVPLETLRSSRGADEVVSCIASRNHGEVTSLGNGRSVVVVRNGRNSAMYTFEVLPEGVGSRVNVRRLIASPFVSWRGCEIQPPR